MEQRRITWRTGAAGVLVGMAFGGIALGLTLAGSPIDQGPNQRIATTTVPPGFELVGPPVTLTDPDPAPSETTLPRLPAVVIPSTGATTEAATVPDVASVPDTSEPAITEPLTPGTLPTVPASDVTLPTLPPVLPPPNAP